MTKYQAVVTALALALAVTACKKKEDKPADPPKTEPAPAPPAPTGSAPGPTGSAPASPVAEDIPADKLPEECAKLKALSERLAACEKLPANAREGFRTSWVMMTKSLKDWDKMSADNQATVKSSCTKATDAMKMFEKNCP